MNRKEEYNEWLRISYFKNAHDFSALKMKSNNKRLCGNY
jgi:hypothetical protein